MCTSSCALNLLGEVGPALGQVRAECWHVPVAAHHCVLQEKGSQRVTIALSSL